ncbi:hypothetical protein V8C86DRAFT_1587052 [Haematococcus lacustris]
MPAPGSRLLLASLALTSQSSRARWAASKKAAKEARREQASLARREQQRSQQWQRPQCDTQQQQQQEQEHVQSASAGYTSQHGGVAPQQLSSLYAAFERHTLGVGSRLMLRMGWSEGMGLGRHSQGRTEPLIMLRRPKNEGLGSAT